MRPSKRTFGNLSIVVWHGTVVLSWLFLWGLEAQCRAATACDFQHETFDHYSNGSSLHGQGGWIGWEDNPAATAFITQVQ